MRKTTEIDLPWSPVSGNDLWSPCGWQKYCHKPSIVSFRDKWRSLAMPLKSSPDILRNHQQKGQAEAQCHRKTKTPLVPYRETTGQAREWDESWKEVSCVGGNWVDGCSSSCTVMLALERKISPEARVGRHQEGTGSPSAEKDNFFEVRRQAP